MKKITIKKEVMVKKPATKKVREAMMKKEGKKC